ncbi:MAG: aldo/keto reductase [Ktedonobacterales bacterium]
MEGDTLVRDASASWLRQGVEQSLRNLGADYIDLYQVHWPDPCTPIEETASTLAQLAEEGKIRYVGASSYDIAQMRKLKRTRKIDTLQPPYQLFRRDIQACYPPILPGAWHRGARVRPTRVWAARRGLYSAHDLRQR